MIGTLMGLTLWDAHNKAVAKACTGLVGTALEQCEAHANANIADFFGGMAAFCFAVLIVCWATKAYLRNAFRSDSSDSPPPAARVRSSVGVADVVDLRRYSSDRTKRTGYWTDRRRREMNGTEDL